MDQKDEIKAKVDLVEVIASYLPLKKSGRNFSALCPFHGEKTPSFMVSAERQAYKCFGCGESGDVFTFLEKMEGWDFREALEELAKKAGVTLKSFAPSGASKLKEKIIEHMQETKEWGEYFPGNVSPFAYNESMAQDYFPLTKEINKKNPKIKKTPK